LPVFIWIVQLSVAVAFSLHRTHKHIERL
jgi:hypothetical protein